MGGQSSPTPVMAQPLSGYTENAASGVRLGGQLTDYAIQLPPELRTPDIDQLQTLAEREATINALKSRRLEEMLDPEVARTRQELKSQVASDLEGGPNTELSNMWLKRGLQDIIATGADTRSGFARSALADKTRADYYANRAASQDRAAAYLRENPQAIAGLDVGSLASAYSQAKNDNANARDAQKAQFLSMAGNNVQNLMSAFQQAAAIEAQRRGQNAQAINAANAASASNSSALLGAGIGATGAIAGGAIAF